MISSVWISCICNKYGYPFVHENVPVLHEQNYPFSPDIPVYYTYGCQLHMYKRMSLQSITVY